MFFLRLKLLDRLWGGMQYSVNRWVMMVAPNRVSSITASPNILQTLKTTIGHGLFVKFKIQILLILAVHMFVRLARAVWRLSFCPSQVLCSWRPRPFTN